MLLVFQILLVYKTILLVTQILLVLKADNIPNAIEAAHKKRMLKELIYITPLLCMNYFLFEI